MVGLTPFVEDSKSLINFPNLGLFWMQGTIPSLTRAPGEVNKPGVFCYLRISRSHPPPAMRLFALSGACET